MAIGAIEAALHQLTGKRGPVADTGDVADKDLAEPRGKRRGIVTDLVGVGKEHITRLLGPN